MMFSVLSKSERYIAISFFISAAVSIIGGITILVLRAIAPKQSLTSPIVFILAFALLATGCVVLLAWYEVKGKNKQYQEQPERDALFTRMTMKVGPSRITIETKDPARINEILEIVQRPQAQPPSHLTIEEEMPLTPRPSGYYEEATAVPEIQLDSANDEKG